MLETSKKRQWCAKKSSDREATGSGFRVSSSSRRVGIVSSSSTSGPSASTLKFQKSNEVHLQPAARTNDIKLLRCNTDIEDVGVKKPSTDAKYIIALAHAYNVGSLDAVRLTDDQKSSRAAKILFTSSSTQGDQAFVQRIYQGYSSEPTIWL